MKIFSQSLFPLSSNQSSSHPAIIDNRSPNEEKQTNKLKNMNNCTHSTISPALRGEDRKVNYIKQTGHSDSTQIVDYCFD